MQSAILDFFSKNKKNIFTFLLIGIFVFFCSIHGVFAEETAPVLDEQTTDKVVSIINGIATGAASVMGLITSFITIFLYPGWTNGSLFGLTDYLKELWILVSNVIYFIFAFILIAIAFMNIIGKGDGMWELKQAMPKFIVGILIVPFSWFFVQFMLSLSAILTVSILTLPYDAFKDKTLFSDALATMELEDEKICKDVVIVLTGEPPEGATSFASADGQSALSERIMCKDENSLISVRELFEGGENAEGLQNSIFGIISVYTYGILKVQELDTISAGDLDSVNKVADLIFKIMFDLLFIVVYMILMVALFLALFVRGIRLWVYMMLSPAFGLLYFLGKGDEGFGSAEDGSKFSIKEFIALAMVPVYVSAALAFGLVFVLVASEGVKTLAEEPDTIKAGGFSLQILGAHGDGASEKSALAKLIVEIFGVAILWIAVMAALKTSETTSQVVNPIAEFGKSVGQLAVKSPTYMPIPGLPGGSAAGLQSMGSNIRSGIEGTATSRGAEAARRFLPDSAQTSVDLSEKSQKAMQTLNASTINNRDSLDALKTAIRGSSVDTIASNKDAMRTLQEYLTKAGIKDIVVKDSDSVAKAIGALDKHYEGAGLDLLGGKFNIDSSKKQISDALTSNNLPETPAAETVSTTETNTFNIKVGNVDATNPTTAGQLYAQNLNLFDTDDKVKADLSSKGITDNATIDAIIAAYNAGKTTPTP